MIPWSVYFFLLFQLCIVAYVDFKTKKISNKWSLVNILIFIICLFLYDHFYQVSFVSLFYPFTFLLVGFILFVLNIMGAGDVKYLFSFYLLVPLQSQETAFLCLAYATLMTGIILLFLNIIQKFDKLKLAIGLKDIKIIKSIFGTRFSYAPVILLSWIWFGWLIWNKKVFIDF